MEQRILISPVGLEYERILYGLTIFPSKVLYLIFDDEPKKDLPRDSGYYQLHKATQKFAQLIKFNAEQLKFEVREKFQGIRLNTIETCIIVLKEIIKSEIEDKNVTEILINVSTATKNFALAAYLIAAYFQQKIRVKLFYLRANNYTILDLFLINDLNEIKKKYLEKGTTFGPYDLEEIPIIPFMPISEDMQQVIHILNKRKSFSSLGSFFLDLIPNYEEKPLKEQKSIRMKYNFILQKLENIGLIYINRRGRMVEISITKTGEMLDIVIS